jgi:phosphomethylpyrimidine synthase
VYIDGEIHPIKKRCVKFRSLDTKLIQWQKKNPPVTVYDTSGPFTDPNLKLIFAGLP